MIKEIKWNNAYFEILFWLPFTLQRFFSFPDFNSFIANYSPTGQREFLFCGTNIRVLLVGCPLTGTTNVDTEGAVDDVLFLPIVTTSKYWRSLNAMCFLASLFVARIAISNNDGICKTKISGLNALKNLAKTCRVTWSPKTNAIEELRLKNGMLLTMKEGEHRVTGFPAVDAFAGRIIRAQTSAAIIEPAVIPWITYITYITYPDKQAFERPPFKRYTCRYKGIHTAPGSIALANSKIAKT